MQVLLRQAVERLGMLGDIVDVKEGYARNYLLPRGLALKVSHVNKQVIEQERESAKSEELARIQRAVRGEPRALASSPIAREAASLSIVDLLAYRDRIAALPEWPFDARALRRFGLYMLIRLGSWISGALPCTSSEVFGQPRLPDGGLGGMASLILASVTPSR